MPFLVHQDDALLQHVHRDVGLLFRHHQRRRKADAVRATTEEEDATFVTASSSWRSNVASSSSDAVRATTEEEDATFERQLDDAVTFSAALRLGRLIGNDLDPDHQASPADIA